MENIITGIALLAIIAVLAAYLISRSKSVERVTRAAKDHEDAAKAARDEAERRRMVHDADLKDASLRGKAKLEELLAASNWVNTDEYRRRLQAGIANQHSASMEPFCGEGKKKRERKQESRAAESDSHEAPFFGFSAASEPSRAASHSSYSGHGGSFDGGGASGDWSSSSSSSSSSDSGSCSSSSSDSGSSSCSSSD